MFFNSHNQHISVFVQHKQIPKSSNRIFWNVNDHTESDMLYDEVHIYSLWKAANHKHIDSVQ